MTQNQDKTPSMQQIEGECFSGDKDDPDIASKKASIEARAMEAMKGNVAYLLVAIRPRVDGDHEVVTSVAGNAKHLPLLTLGVVSLMSKIQETQVASMERAASPIPPSKLN